MTSFDLRRVDEALELLGALLAEEGETVELVVCGGAGLLALRIIERVTVDVDVLAIRVGGHLESARPLPDPVLRARAIVARDYRLPAEWLNDGPTSTLDFGLPEGCERRFEERVYGGLTVLFLSRYDQIHLKLYAFADSAPGSKHEHDLRALAPTVDELLAAARWTRTHDPSEGFLLCLRGALAHLGADGSSVG